MNANGCRCQRCGNEPYITTNMSHEQLALVDMFVVSEKKVAAVEEAERILREGASEPPA